MDNFQLTKPFRALICGPSSSGKSTLLKNILKNKNLFLSEDFDSIIYYYPEYSCSKFRENYIEELKQLYNCVTSVSGLPDYNDLITIKSNTLLIFDDCFEELMNNNVGRQLAIQLSHHQNLSYFVTSQNFFSGGKYLKTFSRQYTDYFLIRGRSEGQWLRILSQQLFNKAIFLPKIFEYLSKHVSPFERVVWIDCNSLSTTKSEDFRVRALFFKNELLTFQYK